MLKALCIVDCPAPHTGTHQQHPHGSKPVTVLYIKTAERQGVFFASTVWKIPACFLYLLSYLSHSQSQNMGWLLTTPTQYKSLFPKSRENWLRSTVRWQMGSVALPETWNHRWHLIYDNKEHQASNRPLAFIFVMSSACRWLTWDSEQNAEHCQEAHMDVCISPSVWSPAWWVWTAAISTSVLVYKKLSEGCLWAFHPALAFVLKTPEIYETVQWYH